MKAPGLRVFLCKGTITFYRICLKELVFLSLTSFMHSYPMLDTIKNGYFCDTSWFAS